MDPLEAKKDPHAIFIENLKILECPKQHQSL